LLITERNDFRTRDNKAIKGVGHFGIGGCFVLPP